MSAPPIVITQSRLKLALWFALYAAISVAFTFTAWLSSLLRDSLLYLGVTAAAPIAAAAALAAIAMAINLARPGTLTVDDIGVCHRTYRRTVKHHWNQIEEFIVFESLGRLRSPGCVLTQAVAGRRFFSYGRAWEKGPEAVVQTLKDAKKAFSA